MPRRRFVWSPEVNDLVEVSTEYQQPDRDVPYVRGDTPGYLSPVTGLWVEGQKARRDDLARTGSRPWEGMEQERKEAIRQKSYADAAYDRQLDNAARKAFHQLSPAKRRQLGG